MLKKCGLNPTEQNPNRSVFEAKMMFRMLSTAAKLVPHAAHCNATPARLFSRWQHYATSSDVISKWKSILSQLSQAPHLDQQTSPLLQTENLRQLLKDAIHVYKTEGAAAVVPDQVTEIFMGVYDSLHTPHQRLPFFTLLAREFGVQGATVDAAVQLWHEKVAATAAASPELLYRLADRLTAAAQPLYMQLFVPVSQHKKGIAFLVRLRADLQQLLREQPGLPQGAALRALSQDLRSALARWFSVGLLQLKRITWEDTPGELLERVMMTEAVHRMQHLEELKRRLQQSDRRVFAFLHPSLHCEPLVVLHTALMDHIPSSMHAVLAEQSSPSSPGSAPCNTQQQQLDLNAQAQAATAARLNKTGHSSSPKGEAVATEASSREASVARHPASVACFYSISSGQPGLSGVDLGNFLIKKAAQQLLAELPQLQHLVTLSPIPGFRSWLVTKLQQEAAATAATAATDSQSNSSTGSISGRNGDLPPAGQQDSKGILKQHEVQMVAAAYQYLEQQGGCSAQGTIAATHSNLHASRADNFTGNKRESPAAAAAGLLKMIQSHAWLQLPEHQQHQVQQMLQRLCAVYLLKEKRRGFALDPVEHFHLRNGAWLWRINSRADLSTAGLDRSCGLMVNYKYVLADVSSNNRAYLVDHVVAASETLKLLLH